MGIIKKALGACTIGLALLPYYASAGSGSAIVPHWDSWEKGTYIFVSNITSHTIEVNFTIYGKDGEEIIPDLYENIFDNQLAPKSSGFIRILTGTDYNRGFGVIEWKNINDEDDSVALVAQAIRVTRSDSQRRGDASIAINSGQPF
ncbi:hypothetical protein GV054_09275 [Marinomonas mediterranea]|uniref:hypothetical protein n=1 Tax=Marinomonas mediterranea TaxID=119864 RepID=UPI00234AED29|nr:hypothetical protein [Marinomonas mediterranea]WCN13184.1 hypothetical protein GV054_09275 [Marinomonas mediterranea]